ncbi:GlxA family transcriptional regulator [Mycobacteroides sp. LB1]|uniref:GlxA family transcriptional regulator n=1 Tax=Mycobacteroides sp. LB1 TaxID=2750814 RepID=UPI0015DE7672|nr:GlxA family transcriptional regulator [Mycobacteroides sp. LB1]
MRPVLIVGFDGVQALDIAGPSDVFTGATQCLSRLGGDSGYAVKVGSVGGAAVRTGTGLEFVSDLLPDPAGLDTVVLPGGAGLELGHHDDELIEWVRTASRTARRVVTVCTGAFLAAEAGLLDDRLVTTHWAFAERLAQQYPRVRVDADRMVIRSSSTVWTSAGVTAGIDLALALVEDDHGVEVAKTVARWLVLYLRRSGGQTQFADPRWRPRAKRAPIRKAQEAVESHPAGTHTIEALAHLAAMSPRHFTRLFTEELGEAPGAYVERIRTEAARRLLERSTDTVPVIAARCGFGSAETLRRHFIRHIGIPPDAYRRAFS